MDVFSALRETISITVRQSLPEPQASLLLGTLLGVTSGFPATFYEALRATGTLHVVVVSGYNISVLINTLARLLIVFPLKIRFGITLAFIVFFVLLVGPEAPVIRAAIMGSIALLATVLGRQGDAMRALIFVAVVMLVFNPNWLTDLSFQLSFLATLGLILIFPLLDQIFPGRGVILREDLLVTLSAQIMVWPLLAYSFGRISLVSPLVNALLLWTIPLITYFGLVTTTMAIIINEFKELIMIPTNLFLSYFIWIVTGVGSLKVGVFEVNLFSPFALVFYYLTLWVGIWFTYQTLRER